jgi:hypothetical protein
MKKYLVGLFACLLIAITSCNQQPYYDQQPAVTYQDNPDQYFNDPQYANQPPVQYAYNGQQMLIDAALMAYLYNNHINPGYYYSTHRTYSHFHVYNNGSYSGYARSYRPRFVTYKSYHYTAPSTRYVTRTHIVIRPSNSSFGSSNSKYKFNNRSTSPEVSTRKSGWFNRSSTSTSSPAKSSWFSSRPSSSSSRSSFGSSSSSRSFGSSSSSRSSGSSSRSSSSRRR